MKCDQCNKDLVPGTIFCPYCGWSVGSTPTNKTPEPAPNRVPQQQVQIPVETSVPVSTLDTTVNQQPHFNSTPGYELGLWQCFLKAIKQSRDFKSRACRKEYWGFAIFSTLCLLLISILYILGMGNDSISLLIVTLVLFLAYFVVGICAGLSLMVRRFHDINMSGWSVLIGLVPYIGQTVIVILLGFIEGKEETNKWGPKAKV